MPTCVWGAVIFLYSPVSFYDFIYEGPRSGIQQIPTLGGLEACASVDQVVFYESIGFFKYNLERPKDTNNNGTGTSDTTKGGLDGEGLMKNPWIVPPPEDFDIQ